MSNKLAKKLTSVVLSATTVIWLSGSAMLLPVAHALTIQELQDQIAALQAQLTALSASSSTAVSCTFSRNLTVGSKGDDVKCLQQYLNGAGHQIAASGPGSPGNETTYFGSLTRAAVAKWQAANGVSPAAGYFGPISRAKHASLAAAPTAPTTPTTPTTPAPTTAGSGLTVTLSPDQPTPGLFGESFASRPFTKLLMTASSDGDVTVKVLTVERTGAGQNAVFSGIVALDEDGVRLGSSKTLGADNKVRLTDAFVVKAGQTKAITLAGDSDADQNDYQGQIANLTLVKVETDGAAVNAALPLTGSPMTVNSTLAVGSLSLSRGSFDPGSGQTKEIGTQGFIFAGLQLTAGSNEDVSVKSIRWNQSGSAGLSDLGNIKVILDGVTYDTTVSSDGKYFTTKFASGITIPKGFNKEMYVKGDVLDGSARTIDFDLYRYADLQVSGLTYGYPLLATSSATETAADNDDDGEFQDAEPRFDAFQHQIGAGTLQVTVSNKIPAQNIAINLADQVLGAFDVIVKGEPISVGQTVFRLSRWAGTGNTGSTQDVTNITLVEHATGKAVAGPVDVAATSPTVTFSDTIVFPIGTNTYVLKGKLGTDYASNNTLAASTTPSTNLSTVRGQTSNVTISPTPTVALTGPTMTVKAGALRVSNLTTPVAQTIVTGLQGFTFANVSLDATASGEDVRLNSVQVEYNWGQTGSQVADDLTSCQFWDGTKSLNTGTNVINPTDSTVTATAGDLTVNFDQSLIIPKGTVKTLAYKCNTAATTSAPAVNYNFTLEVPGDADDMAPTGVTSGSTITETYDDTTGQAITLTNGGTLAVALDSTSPSLKWAAAGSTDTTVSVLKFTATNEAVSLTQLALALGGFSSNTPTDVVKATLWDGATKVGETIFTGDYATVTLSGFLIPKDGDKNLIVKADIATMGTAEGARPGHRVRIEFDGDGRDTSTASTTKGIGQSSSTTIYPTNIVGSPVTQTASTSSNGVLIAKTHPTLSKLAIPSTALDNSSGKVLYRYAITAPSTGGVGLYKMSFSLATTTGGTVAAASTFRVDNFALYGYSDSGFSQPAYDNSGRLTSTSMLAATTTFAARASNDGGESVLSFYFDPVGQAGTREAIQVPAGATRYFQLTGDVNNVGTSSSITVGLRGDSAPTSAVNTANNNVNSTINAYGDNWVGTLGGRGYAFATTAAIVNLVGGTVTPALSLGNATTANAFIWSGNSTTTSSVDHYDWHNGYQLSGLPATGLDSQTLTK